MANSDLQLGAACLCRLCICSAVLEDVRGRVAYAIYEHNCNVGRFVSLHQHPMAFLNNTLCRTALLSVCNACRLFLLTAVRLLLSC